MFSWFARLFRPKTSDEQLIEKLKLATNELRRLGLEAGRRGITVWLRDKRFSHYEILWPQYIFFEEAYRTERTKLG